MRFFTLPKNRLRHDGGVMMTAERRGKAMMGHRQKLHGGDEFDAFAPFRRLLFWRAGQRRQIKRRHNKRARKLARLDLNKGWDEYGLVRSTRNRRDDGKIEIKR